MKPPTLLAAVVSRALSRCGEFRPRQEWALLMAADLTGSMAATARHTRPGLCVTSACLDCSFILADMPLDAHLCVGEFAAAQGQPHRLAGRPALRDCRLRRRLRAASHGDGRMASRLA
jgi:hypothetical protein